MSAFKLTKGAQNDILNIRRYTIDNWGFAQYKKYIDGLRDTLTTLANSPGLGTEKTDLGKGIYSFPYKSHIIYYLYENNQITAFAILHKNMLPANHLKGR